MNNLHRPVEPGDMLILGCRVDDELTAHEVTKVEETHGGMPRFYFTPSCPCGYLDVVALAPVIQDVIGKEVL